MILATKTALLDHISDAEVFYEEVLKRILVLDPELADASIAAVQSAKVKAYYVRVLKVLFGLNRKSEEQIEVAAASKRLPPQ